MADDTRKERDHSARSAEEAALSARLRRLGEGLDRTGASRPNESRNADTRGASDPSGLARAMRLSAEMVGGVIVGAGLGLLLDWLFGSTPLAFIVFLMLGFAGGVLSVMRSAGVLPQRRREVRGSDEK